MKPVRELINDREACERIAEFFLTGEYRGVLHNGDRIRINGRFGMVEISENGYVFAPPAREDYNPFDFIALMNELGYSPVQKA